MENEYRKPNNQELKGSDIIYKGKALTLGSDEYRQPTHYQLKGLDIESIDIIKSILNEDKNGFLNYCIGNIIKYGIRCKKKGQLESDLNKIKVYCDYALDEIRR